MERNPSVAQNSPVTQNVSVAQNPPVAQNSPVTQNPPVAPNPPAALNPPVSQNPPVALNPPVAQNTPVAQNPPETWNLSDITPSNQTPETWNLSDITPSNQTVVPPIFRCIEILSHKQSVRELSASQINKAELIDPNIVIRKYPSYHCINCVPTLAQRLASQSYFGDDVMGRCTVMGCRDSPALPLRELNNLKLKLFLLFPQFWANPLDFEEIWTRCTIAIGQRCKRLACGMATARNTETR